MAQGSPAQGCLCGRGLRLSESEIERVLDAVERYCAEHEAAPLLLTDNDSFQLFRNRRVVFEFLPPRSEQQRLASELDWRSTPCGGSR